MGSHRQRLLDHLPTLVTLLRGEARIDSNDLMTSSCSLILKDDENALHEASRMLLDTR